EEDSLNFAGGNSRVSQGFVGGSASEFPNAATRRPPERRHPDSGDVNGFQGYLESASENKQLFDCIVERDTLQRRDAHRAANTFPDPKYKCPRAAATARSVAHRGPMTVGAADYGRTRQDV